MRGLRSVCPLPRSAGVLACVLAAGLAAGCGERTPAGARAPAGSFPASRGPSTAGPGAAQLYRYRWSKLAASPLGWRSQPILAWTGKELLELGGTTSRGSSAHDGAAFNPATGRWRRIAAVRGNVGFLNAVSVWTGHQLFVANGRFLPCPTLPGGGTPASCLPHAGLYDPAVNHWSQTPLPKQMDGLQLMAAVWTGHDIIVAGAQTHDGRLGVAAYDPAAHHWQMITPRLPARHPPRYVSMVATTGRVILWSLWNRVKKDTNGAVGHAGVDVLARSADGTWRDVTGSWPQNEQVTSPVFTGEMILVAPGQVWCGTACKHVYSWSPGYFADPATLNRTPIPAGPLVQASPAFIWTGRAIIAVNLDAGIGAHGGQGPIRPGDMALWDLATNRWRRLPAPPTHPRLAATPVWAGTRLLALTGTGQLLALSR